MPEPKRPVFPGSGSVQGERVYSPSSRNVRRSSGEFFGLSNLGLTPCLILSAGRARTFAS